VSIKIGELMWLDGDAALWVSPGSNQAIFGRRGASVIFLGETWRGINNAALVKVISVHGVGWVWNYDLVTEARAYIRMSDLEKACEVGATNP
jgi:hypothetical protein